PRAARRAQTTAWVRRVLVAFRLDALVVLDAGLLPAADGTVGAHGLDGLVGRGGPRCGLPCRLRHHGLSAARPVGRAELPEHRPLEEAEPSHGSTIDPSAPNVH